MIFRILKSERMAFCIQQEKSNILLMPPNQKVFTRSYQNEYSLWFISYESYYMNQRYQLKIRSRYDASGVCPGRQTRYCRKYQYRSSTRRKAHFTARYRKFRIFEYFQGEFQNITTSWVCRIFLVYKRQWWKSRYRFDCWCRYFSTFQTLFINYES